MLKKIIDELWLFIYVHFVTAPIAKVSFGFIVVTMLIIWLLFNMI